MPVSFLPILLPIVLIGVPVLLRLKSARAALFGAIGSLLLLATIYLVIYVPGWWYRHQAMGGNPAAQYRYAQWLENSPDRLGNLFLWAPEPDVLDGYAWLEKAAAQNYPPAVWLVGVRLKHGIFVPQPPGWNNGVGGNVFPQPQRGQPMIDRAVKVFGYKPTSDEEGFYWQHYRQGDPP